MARPKKTIKWDEVEERMEAGCSAREIAQNFRISIDTFYDRFKEEYGSSFGDFSSDFAQCGKGNILHAQYRKALDGNTNMLVLLGREWLGQGKEEVKVSPYQETISLSHENMLLRAEIAELRERVNGDESQAR
jgi:AraC-like DNA-binding protein